MNWEGLIGWGRVDEEEHFKLQCSGKTSLQRWDLSKDFKMARGHCAATGRTVRRTRKPGRRNDTENLEMGRVGELQLSSGTGSLLRGWAKEYHGLTLLPVFSFYCTGKNWIVEKESSREIWWKAIQLSNSVEIWVQTKVAASGNDEKWSSY